MRSSVIVYVILLIMLMISSSSFAMGEGYLGIHTEISQDGDGLLVLDVDPQSPAEFVGIHRGDVIKMLNGRRIYDDQEGVVDHIRYNPDTKIYLTVLTREGVIKSGYVYISHVVDQRRSPRINSSNQDNTPVYPEASTTGTVINNFFGDISSRNNQTIQSGTGNEASQENQR